MAKTNSQVDAYIQGAERWRDELAALRRIVLDCGLSEEFKWRIPVYVVDGGNVVSLAALKDSCVLSFFKGSLLKDPHGLLTKPGENSRAARVIRLTGVDEIAKLEPKLRKYIAAAVEVEQAGLKVDFEAEAELPIPEEVQRKFAEHPALKTAFEALTPGRQRAYVLYFSAPKQSKTRTSRIEQYAQRILDGKGINDCVCGHSRKYPSCDGSHKDVG